MRAFVRNVGWSVCGIGAFATAAAATPLLRLADRVARRPAALVVVTTGEYAYRRDDRLYVIPLGALGP